MQNTAAPTTFARLIKRYQIMGSLNNLKFTNTFNVDSRFINLGDNWPPQRFFSGNLSIYGAYGGEIKSNGIHRPDWEFADFTDPTPRSHNLLVIHGRPYPNSNVHRDIVYGLHIPLTQALLHDPTRPLKTWYEPAQVKSNIHESDDKEIFFKAFQRAVADFHSLIHDPLVGTESLVSLSEEPSKLTTTLGRLVNPLRRTA